MLSLRFCLSLALTFLILPIACCRAQVDSHLVDFNRDVRPILSARCFHCHGPDETHREADLRLDVPDQLFAERGGVSVIVPGDSKRSELIRRLHAPDESERMPPPETKVELSATEIETLTRWIQQGALWSSHWSFEPINGVEPPSVDSTITSNAIDQFVIAKLQPLGLSLSPPAERAALLRRAYLDLTGLPPSPDDVDQFLADASPDAFAKVVKRLLNSPQCAERLALDWLDAARFADTNGYSIDDHRDMWLWRDWVIQSFLQNKSYDQFLIEQLAGDLLPDATDQQRIATGFLRNSMNTHEGGTIAEEYRVAAIVDKVDTVSTVFLGLTLKCAQCHEHKYDPLTQRDYYRFFAFFDRTAEPGSGAMNGNTQPLMRADSALLDQQRFREALEERIVALHDSLNEPVGELGGSFAAWQQQQRAMLAETATAESNPSEGNTAIEFSFPSGDESEPRPEWIWSDRTDTPAVWFRKVFEIESLPTRAQLFVTCDNEADLWVNGTHVGLNDHWERPLWIDVTKQLHSGSNLLAIAGRDWETGANAALVVVLQLDHSDGSRQYLLSDGSWEFVASEPEAWTTSLESGDWQQVKVLHPYGAGPWGEPHLKRKSQGSNAEVNAALRLEPHQRTLSQVMSLAEAYAEIDSEYAKLLGSVKEEIRVLRAEIDAGKTSVMVMEDQAAPRETRMLMRGEYDKPGEVVTAGIPAIFGELPADAGNNRLALAQWMVSEANPLTARVAVNRYWQMLFGTGLVKTAEDFGSQGEMPSHPELLDYLAQDFVAHGWDVRHLLEQIMLSQTYAQSSAISSQLREIDPEGRLLARAPRFRLQAELVRDNALAIGGLLDPALGGPSVYPVQPDGLWREISHYGHPIAFTAQNFYPDLSEQLRRRSLYTFWKRTSPPPTMVALDAPSRETCTVRRFRTNTPLQALLLLNEPQFVSAARGLAVRCLSQELSDAERLELAFRYAVAREPSEQELQLLIRSLEKERAYFSSHPERVEEFNRFGMVSVTGEFEAVELAAFTAVASMILNLDETMTRE